MKAFFSLLVLSTIGLVAKAQFAANSDYGIFLGTAYYIGDINQTYHFDSPSVSAGLLFRKNLNTRYSLRTAINYAKLSGSDLDFDNAFKQSRGSSFSTTVIDFSIGTEFNFIPFGETFGKNQFTPYFTVGVGGSYFFTPEKNFYSLTIPFGVGGKFELTERITLAIEWAPRKTFTDDIEGLGSATFEQGSAYENKQRYFSSDNDWFYSVGASLSIKFWEGKSKCRAYSGSR